MNYHVIGVFSVNPYKPDVLFMAHRPIEGPPEATPQNAASHLGLLCLLAQISSKK